jgi:hypothetical protein
MLETNPAESIPFNDFSNFCILLEKYYHGPVHREAVGTHPVRFFKDILDNDKEFAFLVSQGQDIGHLPGIFIHRHILLEDLDRVGSIERKLVWREEFRQIVQLFRQSCEGLWPILSTNRTLNYHWKHHCATITRTPPPDIFSISHNTNIDVPEGCAETMVEYIQVIKIIRQGENDAMTTQFADFQEKASQERIRRQHQAVRGELLGRVSRCEETTTISLDSNRTFQLYTDYQTFKAMGECSARLYYWARRFTRLPRDKQRQLEIIRGGLCGGCAICCDDFDIQADPIQILSCGHCFHAGCGISGWLAANHKCPMCRTKDPTQGDLSVETKEWLLYHPGTGQLAETTDDYLSKILASSPVGVSSRSLTLTQPNSGNLLQPTTDPDDITMDVGTESESERTSLLGRPQVQTPTFLSGFIYRFLGRNFVGAEPRSEMA